MRPRLPRYRVSKLYDRGAALPRISAFMLPAAATASLLLAAIAGCQGYLAVTIIDINHVQHVETHQACDSNTKRQVQFPLFVGTWVN